MKNSFSAKERVFSTTFKQTSNCVTPSSTNSLGYHYPHVIYSITCSRDSLQYVGETS